MHNEPNAVDTVVTKKKKLSEKTVKGLKIALAVFIVVIAFFGGVLTQYLLNGNKSNTLSWVVQMIDKHYYSETDGVVKEFTEQDYANAIIDTLLDDYSAYYTKQEYADVVSTDKGNEYGSGLTF